MQVTFYWYLLGQLQDLELVLFLIFIPRPDPPALHEIPILLSTKDVYLKIALFQLISKLKVIRYMIHSTQPGYQQLKKPR